MHLIPAGLVASAFGLLFGFSTAVVSGVLDRIAADYALSTRATETMVALLVFGAFAGALAAGPLAARLGRRGALLVATCFALAGHAPLLLGTHPPDYALFLALRVLVGIGVGASSAVAPMYVGETTAAAVRGALVTLFQLAVVTGILVAYLVNWAMPAAPWPLVIACGLGPVALGLLAVAAAPESPRWLLRQGRPDRARRIARRLGIEGEMEWNAGDAAPERRGGTARAFADCRLRAVLILVGGLFVLQNLSGIDAILYYAPRIFTQLGFSGGGAALAATVGLGAVNALATVSSLVLVDRLGRRPLLLWGSLVMVAGLLLCAAAGPAGVPVLGLLGLSVFLAAFAVSLGPLPYVLLSELLPGAIRDAGAALAAATNWFFNALVAFTFLSLAEGLGTAGVFLLFATVCAASAAVAWLFVPETRGTPLEAIEAAILEGRSLRHLGQPAAPR